MNEMLGRIEKLIQKYKKKSKRLQKEIDVYPFQRVQKIVGINYAYKMILKDLELICKKELKEIESRTCTEYAPGIMSKYVTKRKLK